MTSYTDALRRVNESLWDSNKQLMTKCENNKAYVVGHKEAIITCSEKQTQLKNC